ncbi:hypothetical protein BH10ACT1_BH10ACT1_22030 [soil metagenome]
MPAVLLVGILAVTGSACSRTKPASTLDTTATERAIDKVIGSRIEPAVREVRCPSEIARGPGKRFGCRAVLEDGDEVRLSVRQIGDHDRLDVALLDAVIDRPAVAVDLRRMLVTTFERAFTVDCGDDVAVVARPRSTFTCSAKDPAGKRTVTVTVVDASGTVTYDVSGT